MIKKRSSENKQFWVNRWDNEKENEWNAECLRELRTEKGNMKQNDINKQLQYDKRASQKDPQFEKRRTRKSYSITG